MAQRRIELRTLCKAYCELHRNAECDTITPLNRSKPSPIFLLDGQKERARRRIELRSLHYFSFPPATRTEMRYSYAIESRTPNGLKGWNEDSGQKPDRRRVRTGHGVSETRANKSGLRNRCLTEDGAGKGSRSSRMSHKQTPGAEERASEQLLAKEVGGAEPAGSRLQQANRYFGRLWFVVQEAPKSIFRLGLDKLNPASPSEAPPRGSVEQIQSPLTQEG
ncbi:hypothetical protein FB451DRAFT_1187980 [Mycena latifolia]|nr:hypothetical protein FB451DRAFT_1187980 [Mycena latifolia]